MKEIIHDVLAFVVVAVAVFLVIGINAWWARTFGLPWLGRRAPKAEVQTLFHGNTKDQDQL